MEGRDKRGGVEMRSPPLRFEASRLGATTTFPTNAADAQPFSPHGQPNGFERPRICAILFKNCPVIKPIVQVAAMSRPEDTLWAPLPFHPPALPSYLTPPSTQTLINPLPPKPTRPLLQRRRIPKIHHLLPDPKCPGRNDQPRPLPPRPLLPLPHPRHRLRFRSLRGNPLFRPSLRRGPTHLGRNGHRSLHARYSASAGCGR